MKYYTSFFIIQETALNNANHAKDALSTQLETSKKEIARLQAVLLNTQKKAIADKSEAIMLKQKEIDTLYSVMDRYWTEGPKNKRPKIQ